MTHISLDTASAPIDALGRTPFARHLLKLIQGVDTSRGAVIGLEGAWGSGKTWLFEQLPRVAQEAKSAGEPIFVTFNPWMVSGTSGLVEALLLQLAAELAVSTKGSDMSQGAEIARKIIDYAGVLGALKHLSPVANLLLPGSGLIFEGLAHAGPKAKEAAAELAPALDHLRKHPEKLSLHAVKAKVIEAIGRFDRLIVVLVDDLDRLPPAELSAMIQAVKAVGDFPQTVYVLAYDPAIVHPALKVALGVPDGKSFLEKVIQVQLRVPDVPDRKFQLYAEQALKEALASVQKAGGGDPAWEEAVSLAASLLQTPRDVRRLVTRLQMMATLAHPLFEDIAVGDLLLAEALQLAHPELIDWIDRNATRVLKIGSERRESADTVRGKFGDPYEGIGLSDQDRDQLEEGFARQREALIGGRIEIKTQTANSLAFLFESLPRSKFVAQPLGGPFRLQRYRQWQRWRCFVKHEEVMTTKEVVQLLEFPASLPESRVFETLGSFLDFCAMVVDVVQGAQHVDAPGFAKTFVAAANKFSDFDLVRRSDDFRALDAMEAVLRQASYDARGPTLTWFVQSASPGLSYGLIRAARNDLFGDRAGSPEQQLIQDESHVKAFTAIWVTRAMDLLHDERASWDKWSPGTFAFWLKEVGAPTERIQAALTTLFERSRPALHAAMERFADDHPFPELPDMTYFPKAGVLKSVLDVSGLAREKFTRLIEFLSKEVARDGGLGN